MTDLDVTALLPDLVPGLLEPAQDVVVARVRSVDACPAPDPEHEAGVLDLEVLEVLRARSLRAGDALAAPFVRLADERLRARAGFDAWNTLPLEPGACLLLGGAGDAAAWRPTAGQGLEGPADPAVASARECVDQVRRPDPARLRRLLCAAGPLGLRFGLAWASDRGRLERDDAAAALCEAVADPETPEGAVDEIARTLTDLAFFAPRRWADRGNVLAVTAIARSIVRATTIEAAARRARLLAACVGSELDPDPEQGLRARLGLLVSIRSPGAPELQGALGRLYAVGTPAEEAIVEELRQLVRRVSPV